MKDAGSFDNFPPIGFLIATKRVAEDENKACFVYREEPMDPQDSGWRVFAGDESQAYLDNPDNSGIYNPTTLLTIDPSLRELLLQPVGSAFEREDGTSEWRVAEDFAVDGEDEVGRQSIGGAWSLEISGIFDRYEDEEGDHVFAAEGRTVRIAIWDFSDKQPAEVLALHREFIQNRDAVAHPSLETFDSTEAGVTRLGFVVVESDDTHDYKVLYGYTIVGNEVAQGAFYFDNDQDREWAINTWNSVEMYR